MRDIVPQGYMARINRSGAHWFGGPSDYANCPNCQSPLVQFMSLDATQSELSFFADRGMKRLPLLNCPRCVVFTRWLLYAVSEYDTVALLEAELGERGYRNDWTREGFGLFIDRKPCVLVPLPDRVQELLRMIDDNDRELRRDEVEEIARFTGHYGPIEAGGDPLIDPINQVGGFPYLPQLLHFVECPRCNDEMVFLACITNDESNGVHVFYENLYLEYSMCIGCGVIGVNTFAI